MKLRNHPRRVRQSSKTHLALSSAAIAVIGGVSAREALAQTIQPIALWDLSNYSDMGSSVSNNNPMPSFGSGTAQSLGMTNNYTDSNGLTGSAAFCDITTQVGDVNAPNSLCWRVRGDQAVTPTHTNGWNLAAPQYTQGVEFDASTVGHSGIVFSFDWFTTTQGIYNMQEQYTLDGSNWINVNPLQNAAANGWVLNTVINFGTSAVNVNGVSVPGLGITGANNNANFGVRLVSAYSPLIGTYASATSGGTGVYNNNSGNWRFQEIQFGFSSTNVAPVAPTLTWNPPSTTWNNATNNANWQDTNGASVNWVNGTNFSAAFTDSAISGGTATVNVSTNGVSAVSVLVSNTNGTYTFTGGPIGGGPLTKTGAGKLVLAAPNNFTKVTINGGTLSTSADINIGNANALLSLNNGSTLQLTKAMTLGRPITFASNGATLDTGTNAISITGQFTALGPFQKIGAGNVTFLGGVNSFDGTGPTTLTAGNLIFAQTNGTSTLVAPTTPGGFNGNIIITGKSHVNFNGGLVDGTGDIEIQTSGGGIGGDNSTATPTTNTINLPIKINSLNKALPFTASIGMNGTFNTETINSVISGSGDVSYDGGKAILTLNNHNTYTGNTIVNNGDIGQIRLGVDNALPATDFLLGGGSANSGNVGTLDLNGHSQTFASITCDQSTLPNIFVPPGQKAGGIANSAAGLATLHINGTSTTVFATTIGTPQFTTINGGAPANNIAIQLDAGNTGTLILEGPNNFTGGVFINGGTLQINPNIYISGTNNAGQNSSALPDNTNVVNNASFIVNAAGSNALGATLANNVSGTGTTTVTPAGVFIANSMTQGALVNHGVTTINTSGTIGPVSGTGTLNIGNGGGSAAVSVGSFSQTTVNVADQAKLTVSSPTLTTSRATSLTISGSGQLDLNHGALLVDNTATPFATVYGYWQTGRNGGTYDGPGIVSSFVKANSTRYGLAVIDGGAVPAGFNPALATNQVLVKPAAFGDSNADGKVDFTDLNAIVSHGKYNNGAAATWSDGDFTGDGIVNFNDINSIVSAGFYLAGAYPSAVKATPTLTGTKHVASPESTTVGVAGDGNPDFRYDPTTGDVTFIRDGFDATKKIRTLTLLSAASKFITGVGLASQNQSGFDIDQTNQQSIARFGGNGITTATLDLGDILPTGLTVPQLTSDLTVYFNYDGSGAADPNGVPANILVPEPTTLSLLGLGAAGLLARRRRRVARPQ
jgi:autotransporter-associated beta strand protein